MIKQWWVNTLAIITERSVFQFLTPADVTTEVGAVQVRNKVSSTRCVVNLLQDMAKNRPAVRK